MTAETLTSLLEAVHKMGSGQWMARCPAHTDRSPSLSIRELEDGRVLIHCFAGCETQAVLSTLGLRFSDLYPANMDRHFYKPIKSRINPYALLKMARSEALIVSIAAADLAIGKDLNDEALNRLLLAADRLNEIADYR